MIADVCQREPIIASLATIPGRERALALVIEDLAGQVDQINVWLQGHERIPSCAMNCKIHVYRVPGNVGAKAKFAWSHLRGFHLLCDDDLSYPVDYARRMVEAVERYGRRAIIGAVGFGSDRKKIKLASAVDDDEQVSVLGTGAAAFHSSLLTLDMLALLTMPNAVDPCFALWAARHNIKRIVIARPADWVRKQKPNGKQLHNSHRYFRDEFQREMMTEIIEGKAAPTPAPQTPGDAVILTRGGGIGNWVMLTPFIQNLDRPTIYVDNRLSWLEQVKALSIWPVVPLDNPEAVIAKHKRVIAPWRGYRKNHPRIIEPERAAWQQGFSEPEHYLSILPGLTNYPTRVPTKAWDGELPKTFTVICNGSNEIAQWKLKRWPLRRIVRFAQMYLTQRSRPYLVYLGGDDCTEEARLIAADVNSSRFIDLTGKTLISEAADVLKRAALVITNDTGLMHVADAVGARIIALWGMTLLEKNRPHNGNARIIQSDGGGCGYFPCWGTADQTNCHRSICMDAIKPESVLMAAQQELNRGKDA